MPMQLPCGGWPSARVQTERPYGLRGSNRVLRGGSWNNNANNCRSANRNNNNPDNYNNNNGFRVCFPSSSTIW